MGPRATSPAGEYKSQPPDRVCHGCFKSQLGWGCKCPPWLCCHLGLCTCKQLLLLVYRRALPGDPLPVISISSEESRTRNKSSTFRAGRRQVPHSRPVCSSPARPGHPAIADPCVCVPAGFGMTTPATVGGKAFLIAYGLFGCAGTILFFNLFLERIISLLAFVMRACRERRLRRSGLLPAPLRPEADGLAGWKPSVYHVLLILGLFAVLLSCCASAMYASVEGWGYVDSLYFCFVTFSTIGFGDLVSSQRAAYRHQGLYRLGNFLFILLGVCCIYSLFNVVSILIKQVLNWMLRKLSCACCARCCPAPGAPLARRNAITPDPDAEGRRLSGELISMRDLTASNKVSLALLQKQLSETANGHPRGACVPARQNGFSGGVGALGIMNNRLAETSAASFPETFQSSKVEQ
ncbi:PREDICTED: potassium channel subfamily K member 12 [Chinchilla lanigera]|uniref:potassium channel subfamily K member 12 n=1 Tax=Chinchilla lanigera TaxID=34839 RepID=UPI00069754D4|nr:PREDICTED: potassium channel subfamily K member 12 [Chinchilla lanigera]